MEEALYRLFENMIDRVSGPMHLRLMMQPLMASIVAVISGFKDAQEHKPAYFWAIFTQPGHRREILKDGWKSIGRVFMLAMLLDVIYQFIVQRWVYPLEALLTAFLLAIVPYLVLRGVANRAGSAISPLRNNF